MRKVLYSSPLSTIFCYREKRVNFIYIRKKEDLAKKLTTEEFISKSRNKHGDRYDYSVSVYINSKSKLKIICKKHGEFLQTASDHYLSGCGCQKCDPTSILGNNKFIEKARSIHGDKYDYSEIKYGKDNYEKVLIICIKHGKFLQTPWAHMRGQGCPHCSPNNKKSNTEDFITKSSLKHHGLYNYSLVEYKTKKEKVKIICPKHGVFEQKAYVHLQGHGCLVCNNSKLENHLRNILLQYSINFKQNKKYDNCRNKLPLPFDFYLPDLNTLIECDGIHHRKPVEHFGGEDRFEYQKNNDQIKTKWCLDNNIILHRVSNFVEIDKLIGLLKIK